MAASSQAGVSLLLSGAQACSERSLVASYLDQSFTPPNIVLDGSVVR